MKRLLNYFFICSTCIFLICEISCKDASSKSVDRNEDDSWVLTPFVKIDSANPILKPGKGYFVCPMRKGGTFWEQKDVFNPAAVARDDKVYLLYRAQDNAGTSRIGVAESKDGIHFTRDPEPVLFPDNDAQKQYEWQGGCEDPRIVEDSNAVYFMTYTAYDGRLARLMIASSRDLFHWTKYGPAFAKADNGKYIDKWSKSGSVVSRYENGRIIATKINGKYWMYWGDQSIWCATSDDLINWSPVELQPKDPAPIALKGQATTMPDLKIVIPTRDKKFDSDLVESGPPAMLTARGILLIYNSRNVHSSGDSSLPEGTYAASQVLLDPADPTRILKRMENYFIKPEKTYELSGQVNNVCFVEGLVRFNNKWFLYYGTADSQIAVAVKE
jgi:predicted GH43/DUF377 family glycosyl hydrolase